MESACFMKNTLLLLISFVLLPVLSYSQKASWSFELHGGTAYNPPLPLIIKQTGEPEIRLNARFETRPFEAPVYWVWRISSWQEEKSWEFEAVHHKLYLLNLPDEVQKFTISHGYNILTVNRSYRKNLFQNFPVTYRIGGGVVLAHPENRVRHKEFDQNLGAFGWGYYIRGPVLNLTLGKRFEFGKRLFLNTEAKLSPSFARVPIVDGHADVWNMAFQLALGLGFNFIAGE